MSKLDEAIESNNGVWPLADKECFRAYGSGVCIYRQEFEKRAKERGWVNGYKWGKEYQCDGKKPNLPGDVMIQVRLVGIGWCEHHRKVHRTVWNPRITRFKITDERYKPVEFATENDANPWREDDSPTNWHERGELPPVGVECEYGPYWHACEIVAYHKGLAVVWDAHELEYFRTNKPEIFRPIKTDRERFIEAAGACLANNFTLVSDDILGELFDAGFKAPNNID